MNTYDLVIIGAGAAGLSAGISFLRKASREDGVPKVLIVESNDEAGRKLLATGNGRCNLTNVAADGYEQTIEFFRNLGVLTTVDSEGRVYPLSKRASVVRDSLLEETLRLGATAICGMKVSAVERGDNDDFVVLIDDAEGKGKILKRVQDDNRVCTQDDKCVRAQDDYRDVIQVVTRQVIVAAGGKAGSQYGATGDSYAIARGLGIEVNSISPALVPLVIEESQRKRFKSLAGVRANAKVRLISGTDVIAESEGEVQFTEKAISGICVFDLSLSYRKAMDSATPLRSAQNDRRDEDNRQGEDGNPIRNDDCPSFWAKSQNPVLVIDLAPGFSEEEITELLGENLAAGIAGVVHEKLAAYILRHCEEQSDVAIQSFNNDEFPTICSHMIKNFVVPISGTLGWKEAQVTLGGVKLSELDEAHMEAAKCPGVYFVGEAVEYTGLCGGFNLDFAWNSGIKAGKRAAGFYNYTIKDN
jgi:predicted flavoprotein YhiN